MSNVSKTWRRLQTQGEGRALASGTECLMQNMQATPRCLYQAWRAKQAVLVLGKDFEGGEVVFGEEDVAGSTLQDVLFGLYT